MAQMFTSASDITSNPGNAALGYSSGVSNNAFNPADANPGANIQSTLGILAQTEAQKRAKERERQLKEQDELAAYLAGTGESVFNMKGPDGKSAGFEMLPGDKEFINEQTNQIRNKIVSEPDKWKFDAELQSNMQKFNQFKNLAGIRATEVAKRKVLAAGTNNMEERARILKSIEDIEKEPIYSGKTPEPYLPSATWDIEKMGVGKDILSGKNDKVIDQLVVGTEKDKDGNEIAIVRPGIRASVLDVRGKLIPGSAEFNEAKNLVESFYSNPSLLTADNIVQINSDIDDYNTIRGLKQGDPNYAPPIGKVYGDNSVEMPPLNPKTIADVAYGLLIQKAGQVGIGKEIKKTKREIEDELSKRKVAEGNLAVNQDEMRLKWAEYYDKKNTLSKEEQKIKDKELLAEGDAVRVFEILNKYGSKKPDAKPTGAQKYQLQNIIQDIAKESERVRLNQVFKESGIDPKEYSAASLPVGDKEIKKLAGIPVLNKEGKPSGISQKPTYGYVVTPNDGDLSSAYFLFGYPKIKEVINPEDGSVVIDTKTEKPKLEEVTEWEIKSGSEAIDSYAQASNNFGTKTNDVIDKISRAQSYLGKMFEQKSSGRKTQPQQAPAKEYVRTGKEIVGPELSSINEADMKEENGVRMYKYNGEWRKVVSRDEKNRLLLE